MSILQQLKENKGTVSSSLGKKLAEEALSGKTEILKEAIELASFEPFNIKAKNIRASAGKIIEQVAEKKPALVAKHLEKLLPALDVPEPQTRWLIIRAFGYCAKENLATAKKAIHHAENFLAADQGLCLAVATESYLSNIGAISTKEAQLVFPILKDASKKASANERDWILEAFLKIYDNLNKDNQKEAIEYAKKYTNAPRKNTQKRAEKIIKKNNPK